MTRLIVLTLVIVKEGHQLQMQMVVRPLTTLTLMLCMSCDAFSSFNTLFLLFFYIRHSFSLNIGNILLCLMNSMLSVVHLL